MLNNSNPIQNLLFVSRRLQNANDALSRLANQMRVFLALAQSGVSNFALVGKKIKKKYPCLNQSAISNFALHVISQVIGPLYAPVLGPVSSRECLDAPAITNLSTNLGLGRWLSEANAAMLPYRIIFRGHSLCSENSMNTETEQQW